MSGNVSRKVTGTGEVATWHTAVASRVGAEMHACYWLVVSGDMDIKRGLVVKFASGLTTFAVDMCTEEREWKEFLFAVRGRFAWEAKPSPGRPRSQSSPLQINLPFATSLSIVILATSERFLYNFLGHSRQNQKLCDF